MIEKNETKCKNCVLIATRAEHKQINENLGTELFRYYQYAIDIYIKVTKSDN